MALNYTENLEKGIELLQKRGAFLTVKDEDRLNTMTIGWGSVGFQWRIPVFAVLVRKSRYTHNLIENATEFTISIPFEEELKKSLVFCGTKSGRDFDKFQECDLKSEGGKEVSTPVIANCGLIYECKIIYKQDMDPSLLDEDLDKNCYPDKDYHTMYFGKIVACYMNK